MDITVQGGTLAGMAAAARLARLGHRVALVTDGTPLGGRWAAAVGPEGELVDALPQVIRLPATWRDLFKKSGGHLQAELNRGGLELVPAPPAEHRFTDGTILVLPSDRGGSTRAVENTFGTAVAHHWRALSEELPTVWAAYRRHALEGIAPVTGKAHRRSLWLDRSLADVAEGLGPQLGRLVTDLGPTPDSPALHAVALHVDQLFGRWQLVGTDGLPRRAGTLLDLLAERLTERGVTVTDVAPATDPDGTVDCRPYLPAGRLFRQGPQPAPAPHISHALDTRADLADGISEVVDHSHARPLTTWHRPTAHGVLVSTHDHRHTTPAPAWGANAPTSAQWLRRSPVAGTDGTLRASSTSPAGAAPWAELGSAALAVYELHERLTGQDSRPTNKDFRAPRLERPAD